MEIGELVRGANPLVMVAVLCGLIFVEEIGIPVPFAPWNMLLVVGGVAIGTGRVRAELFVIAALVAATAGALVGREVFARIGRPAALRVARRLRVDGVVAVAETRLEHGGWHAVWVARLVPGLRVPTTQVAGMSGMTRLNFLKGVVPAIMTYVGLLTAAGALLGPRAEALLLQTQHLAVYAALSVLVTTLGCVVARAALHRPGAARV